MDTLITTHAHVDFDALASVVAAQKIYPRSVIVLPSQVNINVRSFLNLHRDFLPLIEPKFLNNSYRVIVVVDTRQRQRLKIISGFLDEEGIDLHIYDHHPDQEDDLTGSLMVVEALGATTTLLVEEIRKRVITLSELEATVLAMGIYEDTGYLTFSSTTPRDVEALSYLWKQGINTDIIQEFLQRPLTAGQKTLFEKLISQSEFIVVNQRKVLFSWATSEEYIQGIAELVYRLSSIEEAEVAFSLVLMEGKIHVVARSFQEDINLLDMLSFWKVRGHPRATSVTLKYDSVFRARQELMDILKLNLPFPLTAKDIASSPVKTVKIDTPVSEAIALLDEYGHSGFVVVEGEDIAGVVSRKDLNKARRHKLGHAPIKAFMSKNVISALPDEPISSLRLLMIQNNIGRIPLVDDNGKLCGIVTRKDILRSLYQIDPTYSSYDVKLNTGDQPDVYAAGKSIDEVDDLTLHINRELPAEIQKLLFFVSQTAAKEGYQVFLVGGSIRDMLMGSWSPGDIDIAVIPEAIPFARSLNSVMKGKMRIFEPFGTASLFLNGGVRLDLVTARKEFYIAPAALPQVESSSLKNDLFRRDFTINTLACSLNADSFGNLYDFFGGRQDLQSGLIRVLYQLSFVDDPLRILRAVRFEKRFGFRIEEETLGFLKNAVENRILKKVSRTRLNTEVRLIFNESDPPAVLKRLQELKILTFIFPRVHPTSLQWQLMDKVRETFQWSDTRKWKREPDPEITYLSALFYGLPAETISFLGHRMNFSREKIHTMVLSSAELPGIIEKLESEETGPGSVFNLLDPLPVETLLLLRAVAPNLKIKDYPQFYLDNLLKVQPNLSGSHLKEMGLTPGPLYGKILKELKEAVLEGRVRSIEEERNFVLSYLNNNNNKNEV